MRSTNGLLKLFVGDLGDNRKTDLNRLFSKYGEISTIYFDENKRFAFVEFTTSTDAQRALEHTNNKTVNGSKLRVEYAKSSRDHRRPLSRDRSPTAALYSHLQVTANRLPPMQVFRQTYHQQYPSTMLPNSTSTSRGRSLTPPSFKQNTRPTSMHHLRTQDFYYQHPAIYSDPAYYRAYGGDPYSMQRLPPPAFLPSTSPPSSSHAYRNTYSSSGIDRYTTNMSHHRRSRSRRRTSSSRRNRSSGERKRKRRTSSASPRRGPRTPPPPSKLSTQRSRNRSHSNSDAVASMSEQKSSSEDENNEEKRSDSRKSPNDDANRKHSKRKTRE